jgi:transposase
VYASERNRPDVVERRELIRWAQERLSKRHRLLFLDECGCRVGLGRRLVWGLRGHRVAVARPLRGKNFSTIGVIARDGPVARTTMEGAVTKATFLAFVEKRLAPKLKPGDILAMDNLKIHKSPAVIAAIEARGASVLFLPPYSPEFNPIEEGWSKAKGFVRKVAPTNTRELRAAIGQGWRRLRPKDCAGWFRHAGW